jgi:two-component system, sensor histidine kinase ChiS
MIKKTSLARDFKIFSAVIMLSVLVICLFVGIYTQHRYNKLQERRVIYEAGLLDSALGDSLDFATHYINFLANRIAFSSNHDNKFFVDLFSAISYREQDEAPVWNIFSWITPDKKIMASSVEGELKRELDVSSRQYLDLTPAKPGHLIFSAIDIGVLSKQVILPAGMGVSDDKGRFLGTIGLGFGIERIENELQRVLDSEELVFILFSSDFNFILSSSELYHSNLEDLLNDKVIAQLSKEIANGGNDGVFVTPLKNDKYNFSYYRHVSKYPFYLIVGEKTEIVKDKYWQLVFPRIAELCVMGMLFIILLYYFRRQIVSPIVMLAESAKKIAGGDSKVAVHYGQYEEVNLLADQLKEIQYAKEMLAISKNEVELLNVNLENKIHERTIDLEKALEIKTEFLNSMSHEVRTPVQGITTISKGLVEAWNMHTEEKKFALASAVAVNSQRLFSLVSNILDLSTFNTGVMHFNLQKNDLVAIINDVISECKMLYIIDKKIEIVFSHHPQELILLLDVEKISQVLRNLITNSIKFMLEGKIVIEIFEDKENYLYKIVISDEGPGVPKEELEEIFSPFVQSSLNKGKVSGAGLGLSICQKIIKGHNGKIWAVNNKLRGISMIFTLPKDTNITKEGKFSKDKNEKIATNKEIVILMVDDEASCQMSMDLLLSGTGYKMVSKYGGISALKYLSENPGIVDLIFLDLMMPDMYGINVLKVIKETPELKNIPVIIQSGTNDSREIEKTIQYGAEAYIKKPYQRQQVLDILAKYLR